MPSSLFRSRQGGQQVQNPQNNVMNMLAQFNQFKQSFCGDPNAKIAELLQTGKMTKEQYNQLASMAQQMSGLFK